MSSYSYKFCVQTEDQEAIIDLLFSIREELCLPDRQSCRKITELCFAHGGVFGAYDGTLLVGMMGFFYGEPNCDYANKDVVFMYVAGILPEYRLSRVFLIGLRQVLLAFQAEGVQGIKLQAAANNPYTNRLYGRFAQHIGNGRSLRGYETVTFGSSIHDALNRLQKGRRRQVAAPSADRLLTAVR
jgi:hypothetical protein